MHKKGLAAAAVLVIITFVTLSAVVQGEEEVTDVSSEVIHFKFNNQSSYGEDDEHVYDFTSNNNIGYPKNGVRWSRTGGPQRDGAFQFDGSNDRIGVKDANSLSINTSKGFTMAMWVRFDRTAFIGEGTYRDYIHFAGKGGYTNIDYEYMWRQYNRSNSEGRNNRISFYVFNFNGGLGTGSYFQDPITIGEWVHVVGVVNKTHVAIYKNGVLRDADRLSNYDIVPRNGPAPLNLGTADGDSYFKGSIDKLRIYNRALSRTEIQQLYQQGG